MIETKKQKVFVGGPFSLAVGPGSEVPTFDAVLRRSIEQVHAIVCATGALLYSAHIDEEFGLRTDVSKVVPRDYRWLQECDLYIALLPLNSTGTPYRTDGTFVECGIAIGLGKTVVLLIQDSNHPERSVFVQNLDRIPNVVILDWEQSMPNLSSVLAPFLCLGGVIA